MILAGDALGRHVTGGIPGGAEAPSGRRGGKTRAVASAIDHALESAVVAGKVPGVVALAADADGVIYEGAYGTREAGTDRAMTLDTVFWIASMTKAVTT